MGIQPLQREQVDRRPRPLAAQAGRLMAAAFIAAALASAAPAADDDELRPPSLKTPEADPGKEPQKTRRDGKRFETYWERIRRNPKSKDKPWRKLHLSGKLREMVEEVALSDAGIELLQKRLADKEAAVEKWKAASDRRSREVRETLREAQKKLRDVREELEKAGIGSAEREKDPRYVEAVEAVRKLRVRSQVLRDEGNAIAEAEDAKVMAVFTPEQLVQWETAQLAGQYDRQGKKDPVLTDRQLDDIDILCERAAKEMMAAATAKPPAVAAEARCRIIYNVQVRIYEDILDGHQRLRLPKPRLRDHSRWWR